MKKIEDELFCGDGREEELSDEYSNDYFVSIEDVDFEQDEDEDEEGE